MDGDGDHDGGDGDDGDDSGDDSDAGGDEKEDYQMGKLTLFIFCSPYTCYLWLNFKILQVATGNVVKPRAKN